MTTFSNIVIEIVMMERQEHTHTKQQMIGLMNQLVKSQARIIILKNQSLLAIQFEKHLSLYYKKNMMKTFIYI